MYKKYFHKLARILNQEVIHSVLQCEDNLTILLDGQPVCHVGTTIQMFVASGNLRTPEAAELYHKTVHVA